MFNLQCHLSTYGTRSPTLLLVVVVDLLPKRRRGPQDTSRKTGSTHLTLPYPISRSDYRLNDRLTSLLLGEVYQSIRVVPTVLYDIIHPDPTNPVSPTSQREVRPPFLTAVTAKVTDFLVPISSIMDPSTLPPTFNLTTPRSTPSIDR